MRTRVLFICGLLAASPAFAHKEDAGTDGRTDPNKVVCRTEDVTGSRLETQKHCMTVAQWTQLQYEERNTVNKIQSNNSQQGH